VALLSVLGLSFATLTFAQDATVQLVFNGPVEREIVIRQQDATVFDFTAIANVNIEFRRLPFRVDTSGLTVGDAFPDMKVWDVELNAIITPSTDIRWSDYDGPIDVTYTNPNRVSAGARRFKVTVDVFEENDEGDSLTVSLRPFEEGDVWNLDTDTAVPLSQISPSHGLAGRAQTIIVPTLEVQHSALTSSQTVVAGARHVAALSLWLRPNVNALLTELKLSVGAVTGLLSRGEVFNLVLYDEDVRVSDVISLGPELQCPVHDQDFSVLFEHLNIQVTKQETRILTLFFALAANADEGDVYSFFLPAANSFYVKAFGEDGAPLNITGVAANVSDLVTVSVTSSGELLVSRVPDDDETTAREITGGSEEVFVIYRLLTLHEDLVGRTIELLVNDVPDPTVFTSNAFDEVPVLRFRDGDTGALLGETSVQGGASLTPGKAAVYLHPGLYVPKNSHKDLVVSGLVNTQAHGADPGARVFVHLLRVEAESKSPGFAPRVAWTGPITSSERIYTPEGEPTAVGSSPIPEQISERVTLELGYNFTGAQGEPNSPTTAFNTIPSLTSTCFRWDIPAQNWVLRDIHGSDAGVPITKGQGIVEHSALRRWVVRPTTPWEDGVIHLQPGWNLILAPAVRDFDVYGPMDQAATLDTLLDAADVSGIAPVTIAIWNRGSYLVARDAGEQRIYSPSPQVVREARVPRGTCFFIHVQDESDLDPNLGYRSSSGAPTLRLEEGVSGQVEGPPTPPFSRLSPRGKLSTTWGRLKGQP
tara:strand:+ start:521 stop:2803 length:2283 start_codon:yes stop_codon:yes gene_type:complete